MVANNLDIVLYYATICCRAKKGQNTIQRNRISLAVALLYLTVLKFAVCQVVCYIAQISVCFYGYLGYNVFVQLTLSGRVNSRVWFWGYKLMMYPNLRTVLLVF